MSVRAGGSARWTAALALLVASLGGCATAAELELPSLGEAGPAGEPSARFAGLGLRERRETVLAALDRAGGYAAPRCRAGRVAPSDGARRAFPLERCEHDVLAASADGPTLGGVAVRALVTHFVDARLVRLDARLEREVAAGGAPPSGPREALAARLDERLGSRRDAGAATAPDGVIRWSLGDDVVELGAAATPRLGLVDAAALAALPALGEEDPLGPPDGD